MGQMSKKIGMLATLGFSGGMIALGSGCNSTAPTTQANGNQVHSDVTDVRPIEPVQASYQPPIYDTSTNIPTVKQPVTGYAAAPVTPVADETPMVSSTPGGGSYAGKSTHTVRKGETLFSIAKATYGSGKEWKKIVSANPGISPSKLKVGQVLVLPAAS
jgi:nucleoid-associated protein YgaU